MRGRITGTGSYVPAKTLTNADLENMVATSDQWITERTGIRSRAVVGPGEACSDLAVKAARRALEAANISATDLDMILLATCTGDYPLPATACLIQHQLGATKAAACDLGAACCGFVYALSMADAYVKTGMRHVLVVGSEVMSAITDWTDRNTCVLFGDGAGAAVVSASEGASGVLSTHLRSDGALWELIAVPGGGSRLPPSEKVVTEKLNCIKMKGNETFKVAVKAMADVSQSLLTEQGITHEQVDLFIPHQANLRIIDAVGERLKIDPQKVYKNVDRYGNTSAASIPIALEECVRDGRVETGDMVLMTAFGAGLVWGSVLLRW